MTARHALALVTALALAAPSRAAAEHDGRTRPIRLTFDPTDRDKQAHIAVSYGVTLTVAVIARHYEVTRWKAVLAGAATALVLGTLKELVDDPYSWGDQAANTIGAGAAVGVVFAFRL